MEEKKITIKVVSEYLIISWNIDGLRPEIWTYLKDQILSKKPHIFCLNETKKPVEFLKEMFSSLEDYNFIINSHNPPRWHGVTILIRKDVKYTQILSTLKCLPRKGTISNDPACGRVITISVNGRFNLVATYVPNSGVDRKNPLKNLPYRIKEWDPALFDYLNNLSNTGPTIWIGDINVCPNEIDVSHPKSMIKYAGFTKEERESLEKFIKNSGWIDIWRLQHPNDKVYSYRGYTKTFGGMRLDNIIVSKDLKNKISESFIDYDCPANTDHTPSGIKFNI